MERKKCKDIQEGKSYEPIDVSFHYIDDKKLEAVDGILPKCDKGGIEILINPDEGEPLFLLSDSNHAASGLVLNDLTL